MLKLPLFRCNAKSTQNGHLERVESNFFMALKVVLVLAGDAGADACPSAQSGANRGLIQDRQKQEADMTSGTAKYHAEPQRSRQWKEIATQ